MTPAVQRRPAATTGPPLLASKLVAPSVPGRVVERPRLFELLDAGVERPVTLVAAPAGSGKTMLLTSWMSAVSPPGPVAWLSLDQGDNDPVRFWAYLLAALCRSGALPADSDLRALVPSPQGDDTLASMLLHGLEELTSPVVLMLDDVHELTEPRVLDGIELLLRHAPPRLRLVLSSRADPPLPLHRLLVSGRLTQLRGADLAFTVAEVAELLAEYHYRPRLSEEDLAVLQARTEGWAAGLRLAAVSMQHQPDPHRYVMELAGDDRSLAGYLVAEVLEQQPAELRGFLLRTCVVDKLTGELADALTGREDGELILARLERANAFVVALGSRREWYRYHPLFAELLRYELRREAPHEVPELRRRAARWYAGHGLLADAIQQAGMVGDWGSAAGYLEQAAEGAAAAPDRSLRVAVRLLAGRLRDAKADPAGTVDALSPFLDELALASVDPAPAVVSEMPVLIEALSERERTVLRYLPTMLTFGEIGSELYISVNTTKSHVRNIYRKLGAVGRRDAVRRARQLQLLRS
jgi:LuxR family maltose regulon positive regulatory protein